MNESKEVLEILGLPGRLVSSSKGQYRYDNPTNVVVYNANIVTKRGEKLWYGDIDLTLEESKIQRLAVALNTSLYVLPEMAARFENEKEPKFDQYVYFTNGETSQFPSHVEKLGGRLFLKKTPELTEEEKKFREDEIKNSYNHEEFEIFHINLDGLDDESEEDYQEYFNYLDVVQFFQELNEENGPLHNFQKWVMEKQNVKKEDYFKLYLTKETAHKLKKQVEYWYRVFHAEFETEYRIKSNVDMLWFSYCPAYFEENPDWVEEGRVYFKKD